MQSNQFLELTSFYYDEPSNSTKALFTRYEALENNPKSLMGSQEKSFDGSVDRAFLLAHAREIADAHIQIVDGSLPAEPTEPTSSTNGAIAGGSIWREVINKATGVVSLQNAGGVAFGQDADGNTVTVTFVEDGVEKSVVFRNNGGELSNPDYDIRIKE